MRPAIIRLPFPEDIGTLSRIIAVERAQKQWMQMERSATIGWFT
jgi:hypothetical protein